MTSPYDTPSGADWYDQNTNAYATLATGTVNGGTGTQYAFTNWSSDASGTDLTSNAIYMNGPKTATANWKTQYYLTMSTNFGTVNPTSGWQDPGSLITITATPPSLVYTPDKERYVWLGWTGTGSGSNTTTFNPAQITMNSPITQTAAWRHEYKFTLITHDLKLPSQLTVVYNNSDPIGGAGDTVPYNSWFEENTLINLQVSWVVYAGTTQCTFDHWSGDLSGRTQIVPVIMNAPKYITANYYTQYWLTVTSPYGTTGGEGWYNDSLTAYATVTPLTVSGPPGTQYVFTGWSGDATGTTSPSDPITMDAPKTAVANWKTQYEVTFQQTGAAAPVQVAYTADTDPTVTVPFSIWAKAGTTLTFTYDAIINDGQPMRYVLDSVDQPSSLTVNGPLTITATYKTQHYLTVNHAPADSILDGHQTGEGYYDANTNATVTADQYVDIILGASRYRFDHWSTDASGTTTTTEVNMTAPKTATANYETQYYLTVTSAHNTPTPSAWVDAGTDFTASVTSPADIVPNDHQWVCTGFSIDGGAAQAGTSHTFQNVDATHSIVFNWKEQFWIQVNSAHDSPTASQWIDQAGSLTASVTSPADDDGAGTRYRCTGYTLDADPPVTDGTTSYDFTNVQSAHTITFNWITQYRLTIASDHDSPNPSVGEHWYDTGTTITATVTSPADENNGIRYRCTGSSGSGSVPTSGTDPSLSFTIEAPSTLTWNWIVQYKLTVASDHDSPVPGVGDHWYDTGSFVSASVTSPADDDLAGTRYRCTGWTGTGSVPSSGTETSTEFTITTPSTLMWNWIPQYYVTFQQTGLDNTATSTVVTIDSTTKSKGELPYADWFDGGTTYSFSSIVDSSTTNKRFRLDSITGQASPITAPGTVTGNYVPQYKVTFTQTGLDNTATGTVVTVEAQVKNYVDLPFTTDWLDHNTPINFQYEDIVSSTTPGKRFKLDNVDHTSPLTVTEPTTVTGTYGIQYQITVTATPAGAIGATFKVTYTQSGTTHTNVLETTSWTEWTDANTDVTVSEPQQYYPNETGSGGVRYLFDHYDPSNSATMTQAKTITLAYQTQYYLTVVSKYNGATMDTPSGEDWYNESETAYAMLDYGFEYVNGVAVGFAGWTEGASGWQLTSDPIVMDGPKTATALWEASQAYGDIRTIGFWRHQFTVWYRTTLKIKGAGTAQVSVQELNAYLTYIWTNSDYFKAKYPTGITRMNAYELLAPLKVHTMKEAAEQQLFALWLNFAAKTFFWNTELSQSTLYAYCKYDLWDGAGLQTIGEAIRWAEAELTNTNGNYEAAKTVCDSINNNLGIIWGT